MANLLGKMVGNKISKSTHSRWYLPKKMPSVYIYNGLNFQTIRIWDASTGLCLATLLGHDNWVRGLAFHPGGKYLLSVSDDKSLRIWDVAHRFVSKFSNLGNV